MEKGFLMGCCSPNYRKTVNEQEEEINRKGIEKIPLLGKIIMIMVMIGGLIIAYLT
jgi:hypothetical protein